MAATKVIMKNITIYFVLGICLLFSACCCQDTCRECGGHGACDQADGSCACYTGYEHDVMGECDSISREKFIATYYVSRICANDTTTYLASIYASPLSVEKVIIKHYGGYLTDSLALEILASVNDNWLTIAEQTIVLNNQSFNISAANAEIFANRFSLTDTIAIDGGTPETCTSVFTKQ